MKMITISIDFDYNYPRTKLLKEFEQHNIKVLKYTKNGPAGGNPNYHLQATEEDFDNYLSPFSMFITIDETDIN